MESFDFNPRSHTGSDSEDAGGGAGRSISIHAPTRGATMSHYGMTLFSSISIHAPTRGATRFYNTWWTFAKFQSTLPHGERLNSVIDVSYNDEFQSTLPHGERQKTDCIDWR